MTVAVKEVERKVTKVGNSLGVTLPQEVLEHLGLSQGDDISFDLETGHVKIQKAKKVRLPKGIDNEFLDIVGDMIEEYEETFTGLVDR